jgi:hypothetical protein
MKTDDIETYLKLIERQIASVRFGIANDHEALSGEEAVNIAQLACRLGMTITQLQEQSKSDAVSPY